MAWDPVSLATPGTLKYLAFSVSNLNLGFISPSPFPPFVHLHARNTGMKSLGNVLEDKVLSFVPKAYETILMEIEGG